jgi:hypothetical protein
MPKRTEQGAVVVTGASDGIGLAIARRFLQAGHSVVMIARGSARLAAAVQMLQPVVKEGCRLLPLSLDVTTPDAPEKIEQALAEEGLEMAVLINNAGLGLGGAFAEHDAAELERLIALNIAALNRLTHHAIRKMQLRGSGHIINVASLGGYVPGPNQAAYYASKAYVISLSEALAHEQRGSGVRVCVVAPGPVDTSFHAAMRAERALYRRLLPALSPERVAAAVYRGYRLRLTVVIPGLTNRLVAMALRVLPHPLSVPLVGWLLAPAPTSQT